MLRLFLFPRFRMVVICKDQFILLQGLEPSIPDLSPNLIYIVVPLTSEDLYG